MTTTPVTFLEHKPEVKLPDEVSLIDHFAGVDPAQVCRTCVFNGDRLHRFSFSEKTKLFKTGHASSHGCTPDEALEFKKVLSDQSIINGTTPTPDGQTVSAFVDTCGWSDAAKCMGCARLKRQTVSVPYTLFNGQTRYRQVTVGGYCSIPAEGITVGTHTGVTCDFRPRPYNVDPSCANCEFNMSISNNWMIDEFDIEVVKTELDAFEMYLARRKAMMTDTNIGGVINADRFRLTSHPAGVFAWYRAEILGVRAKNGTTLLGADPIMRSTDLHTTPLWRIREVKIRFTASGWTGWLPLWNDDETVHIEPVWAQARAGVQIMLPRHEQFGLPIRNRKKYRVLPIDVSAYQVTESEIPAESRTEWACAHAKATPPFLDRQCTKCMASLLLLHPPAPGRTDLVEWDFFEGKRCPYCHPVRGACYFHARQPFMDFASGEIVFDAADPKRQIERLERLHVTERGRVVNDDNEDPDMLVFAARLRSLMANAPSRDAAFVILNQYHQALGELPLSRPHEYEVGYGAPLAMEPWKNYCALALERTITRVDRDRINSRTGEPGVTVKRMIPPRGSSPVPDTRGVLHEDGVPEEPMPGLDFRAVMGDSFGLMAGEQWDLRSSRRFTDGVDRGKLVDAPAQGRQRATWSDRMRDEEWIRGYNPLERLSEEELINEAITVASRIGMANEPWVEPTEWHTTKLDCRGAPADEWAVYTPEADRAAYIEYLDEEVTVPMNHTDIEVDDGIARHDTTAVFSRRWLLYGYDNYKGGKRGKTDEANLFSFNHMRVADDEGEAEVIQAFVCPVCDTQYSHDELQSMAGPDGIEYVCPDDASPLLWMETADESRRSVSFSQLRDIPKPERGRRGIGSAVAGDSEAYQAQTRLLRLNCDSWQQKNSSTLRPIKLTNLATKKGPR